MTSTKTPRIGQKMRAAAWYVNDHPGCTKLAAAEAIDSRRGGYAAVDRAIRAGLVNARWTGRRYQLFPADWNLNEIAF